MPERNWKFTIEATSETETFTDVYHVTGENGQQAEDKAMEAAAAKRPEANSFFTVDHEETEYIFKLIQPDGEFIDAYTHPEQAQAERFFNARYRAEIEGGALIQKCSFDGEPQTGETHFVIETTPALKPTIFHALAERHDESDEFTTACGQRFKAFELGFNQANDLEHNADFITCEGCKAAINPPARPFDNTSVNAPLTPLAKTLIQVKAAQVLRNHAKKPFTFAELQTLVFDKDATINQRFALKDALIILTSERDRTKSEYFHRTHNTNGDTIYIYMVKQPDMEPTASTPDAPADQPDKIQKRIDQLNKEIDADVSQIQVFDTATALRQHQLRTQILHTARKIEEVNYLLNLR